MDPLNYYTTTFITAFKNLAPLIAFLIGGYFIFIKLPFLFLKKSMDKQKKKLETEGESKPPEEKYTIEHYQDFQKRLRLMNAAMTSEKRESPNQKKEEKKQEKKEERFDRRAEQKSEQKNERRFDQNAKSNDREERRKSDASPKSKSPEEIFELKAGEVLSQGELKKRYFELLKKNHPDRVASMGSDFKYLAEKNTKEINKAYEALKRKAS